MDFKEVMPADKYSGLADGTCDGCVVERFRAGFAKRRSLVRGPVGVRGPLGPCLGLASGAAWAQLGGGDGAIFFGA